MITTILLYIILTILNFLLTPLKLLPDASLPDSFINAMTSASAYITPLNSFLPIDTIILIIGLVISIEVIVNAFILINWAIKKIPTIS